MAYSGRPSPFNPIANRRMTNLEEMRERERLALSLDGGHSCVRHGRWWQCNRCAFDEASELRKERNTRRAWIAKGAPKAFCETMVQLDKLKRKLHELKN